jgi:hypothetical protein
MTRPLAGNPRRSRGSRHAAAAAILLGITLLFFTGLLVGRTYSDVARYQRMTWPWADPAAPSGTPGFIHFDQVKSYYPWQVFINRSLRDGEVPLWNPYSFAGTPFLAANANSVLYPPRAILSLVASPMRVHDALVATHMLIAGLTMYLLLVYLRVCFGGAMLGAVAWMASSFMLAWLALEHFVVVAALLPLALLLTDVSMRRRSWAATLALGVVLALLFFGGNVLFVELCFLMLAIYGGALLIGRTAASRRSRAQDRTHRLAGDLSRFSIPWLQCAGLSAVTLLPTVELVRSTARDPLSYTELRDTSLPASELANILLPPGLGEASFLRDPYHAALFGGTAVGVLAVLALAVRRPGVWFARILAFVTLLVALGTPLLALPYLTLPGFGNLKPLGRVLFLFAFALAILAAYGLDAVTSRLREHTRGRVGALAVVLVPVAVIGMTLLQLRIYAGDVVRSQEQLPRLSYPATPMVKRMLNDPDKRFLAVGGVLPGSTSMVYPLRNALGYESIVPGRVQDFWRVVSGLPLGELQHVPVQSAFEPLPSAEDLRWDLLPRAGIEYVAMPPAQKGLPVDTPAKLVYDGEDGRLARVDDALPRAYVVGRCEEVADSRAALRRFQERDFDPRMAVVLERGTARAAGCVRREAPASGSARIVRERVNGLTLNVNAGASGFLVVNDTWDAGWRATVDGRDTAVVPANGLFRAVHLRAGQHVVQLRYAPTSYTAGLWISVATLLLTLTGFAAISLRGRTWFTRARVG